MSLVEQIRTRADAQTDFGNWTRDFNIAGCLRRAARIIAAMAQVLAGIVDVQAQAIKVTTQRMAVVNEVLKTVNEGYSTIKGGDENTPAVWATGSSDEIDLILDVLAAEGVD